VTKTRIQKHGGKYYKSVTFQKKLLIQGFCVTF